MCETDWLEYCIAGNFHEHNFHESLTNILQQVACQTGQAASAKS